MFSILDKEVISKGTKALVYCGWMHAMTHLVPPVIKDGHVIREEKRVRFGNLISKRCADRLFSVFFYAGYFYVPDSEKFTIDVVVPVHGVVEDVMSRVQNRPVGFDLAPSPFGALSDTVAFFRFMDPDWTLADVCDGYIYLTPIAEWRPVTIENIFPDQAVFDKVMKSKDDNEADFLREQIRDARRTISYWSSRAYENLGRQP
jgi:hypothetical protein